MKRVQRREGIGKRSGTSLGFCARSLERPAIVSKESTGLDAQGAVQSRDKTDNRELVEMKWLQ